MDRTDTLQQSWGALDDENNGCCFNNHDVTEYEAASSASHASIWYSPELSKENHNNVSVSIPSTSAASEKPYERQVSRYLFESDSDDEHSSRKSQSNFNNKEHQDDSIFGSDFDVTSDSRYSEKNCLEQSHQVNESAPCKQTGGEFLHRNQVDVFHVDINNASSTKLPRLVHGATPTSTANNVPDSPIPACSSNSSVPSSIKNFKSHASQPLDNNEHEPQGNGSFQSSITPLSSVTNPSEFLMRVKVVRRKSYALFCCLFLMDFLPQHAVSVCATVLPTRT